MSLSVALCCESGPDVGTGHSMRCGTLAEEVMRGGGQASMYVVGELADFVRDRLQRLGVGYVEAPNHPQLADLAEADVIVVDGYGLGELLERLDASLTPVAVIDDNGELPVGGATWVVNQNMHAGQIKYPSGPVMLLGPDYALLRRSVVEVGARRNPTPGTVLVAMGGSDPQRLTLPTVRALLDYAPARVDVAISRSHPDFSELDRLIASDVRVHHADRDLHDAFTRATIAVVGAGTTMWELAHLGVPFVPVVVAENQVKGAASAVEGGFAAGRASMLSPPEAIAETAMLLVRDDDRLAAMAAAGRRVVDGRGAERVVNALMSARTPHR